MRKWRSIQFMQRLPSVCEVPQALWWWPVGNRRWGWREAAPYPGDSLLWCGLQLKGCKKSRGRQPWFAKNGPRTTHGSSICSAFFEKCTFSGPTLDLPNQKLPGAPHPSSLCSQARQGAMKLESHWFQGKASRPAIRCLGLQRWPLLG